MNKPIGIVGFIGDKTITEIQCCYCHELHEQDNIVHIPICKECLERLSEQFRKPESPISLLSEWILEKKLGKEKFEELLFQKLGIRRIKFEVLGTPIPKSRPRFSRRSGTMYTPRRTQDAEKSFLEQALCHKPSEPIKEPISLYIRFVMPIPKSTSKKKRQEMLEGKIQPAKRPDIDNLVKLVKDALNGIFWLDDSQIVTLFAQKVYGEIPKTEVEIRW